MRRFYQAVLSSAVAIFAAAVVLSLANECWSEQTPNDDPADVALLRKAMRGVIKMDSNRNIVSVESDWPYLQLQPEMQNALLRLRNVRRFTIWKHLDPFVISLLKKWTGLEEICIRKPIADTDLANFEHLGRLKSLAIYAPSFSDKSMAAIAKFTRLETLIINDDVLLTDKCMNEIAKLHNLKYLDLRGNLITDEGLKQIKGMRLEYLGLFSTKITDKGIREIANMTSLKRLDVCDTKVSNSSLTTLAGIPDLKIDGLPTEELHETPDNRIDVAAIEAAGIILNKSNVTENVYEASGPNDLNSARPSTWMRH